MSDSLLPHGLYPARLLNPWEFSRQEYWCGFAISFSRGSSGPRDWTCITYIGRRVLCHWATWEAANLVIKGWGHCNLSDQATTPPQPAFSVSPSDGLVCSVLGMVMALHYCYGCITIPYYPILPAQEEGSNIIREFLICLLIDAFVFPVGPWLVLLTNKKAKIRQQYEW